MSRCANARWTWASMSPGSTTLPETSTSVSPSRPGPTSTTRPSSSTTSARATVAEAASNTEPPESRVRGMESPRVDVPPSVGLVRRGFRHAGRMHFSEHELTAALNGAAKSVVTAQRKDVRKGTVRHRHGVGRDGPPREVPAARRARVTRSCPCWRPCPRSRWRPEPGRRTRTGRSARSSPGWSGDDVGRLQRAVTGQGPHRAGADGARERPAASRSRRVQRGRLARRARLAPCQ